MDGLFTDFHDGGGGGGEEAFDGIEGAMDGFQRAGRAAEGFQEGAAEGIDGGIGTGEKGLVFV